VPKKTAITRLDSVSETIISTSVKPARALSRIADVFMSVLFRSYEDAQVTVGDLVVSAR
jgi:hypothetical protein